jgi:hypothetical protein
MKRIAAFPLWYFATLGTYFVLADLTTTPRALGFVVAAAVAALVTIDPLHLFWAQTTQDATSPANVAASSVARRESQAADQPRV